MGKHLLKKFILFVLPVSMILASCSSVPEKPNMNAKDALPKINVKQEDFDEIDFDGNDLKPVTIENPDLYNNTFRDVSPNFSFDVKGISHILSETMVSNINEAVSVTDHRGEAVVFAGSLNPSTNRLTVSASSPYEKGRTYTAKLLDETLQFHVEQTIHESIREIYFSVKEEDKDVLSTKDDIRTLPLENVLENAKDPLEPHKSLLYKGSVDVAQNEVIQFVSADLNHDAYDASKTYEVGDLVVYKNSLYQCKTAVTSPEAFDLSKWEAQKVDDTLYIKVTSSKDENGNTRIYYDSPSVDEVINDMDLHVDDKPLECNEHNFHLADESKMYDDLLNSDIVMDYVAYAAYAYNFSDDNSAVVDFIKSCTINITFKFIEGGISLQVNILFKHEFESGWVLALNIVFEWQETYQISADAEIETFAGIPVDVDMSMSSTKKDKFTIKGSIIFSHSTFNPGPDWGEPKSLDLNKAKEAVQQLKDKWVDGNMFDSKRERTESGVTLFNIGWVDFYFGYVTVSVEFYLYLTSAISISLGFGYTYENTTTLVNFSTSQGNKGGSASPSGVTANCLDVDLVGKYYLEFGLKVRFSVYITGLRWIISLQLDLDAGLYLNITGFGGFVANLVTGDISLDVGFVLEIGFVLRVTLSVVLFGTGYGNWEIWSLKKPLITFGNTNMIQDRVEETVNLSKQVTPINSTNMMKFTVFDGSAMLSTVKTFDYREELIIADSVFWDLPISRKLVRSCVSKNPEYVTIQDDSFVIADDAPNLFDAVVELTVEDLFASQKHTYEVNVHYQKEGTKVVSFDGTNQVAYDKGAEIEFPTVSQEGKIFKGWKLNGELVDLSKPYRMGTEDINFTSYFIEDKEFLVNFYDGKGNLVDSKYVKNEDAAALPDPSKRDEKMEGYVFVGWDTDLSCVKDNLEVHGIYVKVEEVEE